MLCSSLVAVAYLTLLERKMLSYCQTRKGPAKLGSLQPWADGVKLSSKNIRVPTLSLAHLYLGSPLWGSYVCCCLWSLYETPSAFLDSSLGLIFFLVMSSLAVYGVVLAGWGANSWYSTLGAHRAVAQSVSYEVSLILILLFYVSLVGSFYLMDSESWLGLIFPPLTLSWFSSSLAETNRSPYDFAEGESELVSGFHVEYGGGSFSLLFLAEYGTLLFSCYFTSSLLGVGTGFSGVVFGSSWVRAVLPRLRYDRLSLLSWKCYLPTALGALVLASGLAKSSFIMGGTGGVFFTLPPMG